MNTSYYRSRSLSALFVVAGLLVPSLGLASILYENDPPNTNVNTGTSQSDEGLIQTGLMEPNYCATGCGTTSTPYPSQPAYLGDVFALNQESTITSFTLYEVGDVPTTGDCATCAAADTPGSEFSSVGLYIGPDGENLSLASGTPTSASQYKPGGVPLDYLCTTCATPTYYAIWAITFSGLNITVPAGDYDFAINGVAKSGNTFALLSSDTAGCTPSCVSDTPGLGFDLFQQDGPGGPPILTYSGTNPSSYTGGDNLDLDALIQGAAIPEPATFGFLAVGLAGILLGRRRARR
jgi:hypothetical protein